MACWPDNRHAAKLAFVGWVLWAHRSPTVHDSSNQIYVVMVDMGCHMFALQKHGVLKAPSHDMDDHANAPAAPSSTAGDKTCEAPAVTTDQGTPAAVEAEPFAIPTSSTAQAADEGTAAKPLVQAAKALASVLMGTVSPILLSSANPDTAPTAATSAPTAATSAPPTATTSAPPVQGLQQPSASPSNPEPTTVQDMSALPDSRWWESCPAEWLRKASSRGQQDYLFCPPSHVLQDGPGGDPKAKELLKQRWQAGEPIIVTGVQVCSFWPTHCAVGGRIVLACMYLPASLICSCLAFNPLGIGSGLVLAWS